MTLRSPESPSNNTTPSFTGHSRGALPRSPCPDYGGDKAKGTVVSTATATGTGTRWTSGNASPALSSWTVIAVAKFARAFVTPRGPCRQERTGDVDLSLPLAVNTPAAIPLPNSAAVHPPALPSGLVQVVPVCSGASGWNLFLDCVDLHRCQHATDQRDRLGPHGESGPSMVEEPSSLHCPLHLWRLCRGAAAEQRRSAFELPQRNRLAWSTPERPSCKLRFPPVGSRAMRRPSGSSSGCSGCSRCRQGHRSL